MNKPQLSIDNQRLRDITPGRLRLSQPPCIRSMVVKHEMGWAVARLGSGIVLVGYHLNQPPSDDSWQGWLDTKKREIQASNLGRVVVFSEGGTPNKDQQSLLKQSIYPEWTSRQISAKVGVHIVTSNPVFGTLVGATVAVLRMGAKTFGFDRIIDFFATSEGALGFSGIPRDEWEQMRDVRDYLRQELRSQG